MGPSEDPSSALALGNTTDLPVPRILLRKPGTLELVKAPPKDVGEEQLRDLEAEQGFPSLDASVIEWSKDGRFLATICGAGVEILDMVPARKVGHVDAPGVKALHFSPMGTYLLTWQNPIKAPEGKKAPGNLVVWATDSWTEVLRVSQRQLRKAAWPSLQWSSDELVAARAQDNDIQIYHGQRLDQGVIGRVACPKLGGFSLAPGSAPYTIVTFVPEMKGKPGKISLWRYPGADGPVSSRSSFRAQEASFRWSPDGRAVLCLTSTDVDATGKSYYGSTGLYLLHADGSFDTTIAPAKEGTIQDVQWGPQGSKGNKFVVIAGTMPSTSTLYNLKGEPTFEFCSAHRNTISWSPHGRFLILAGLGNLAGEMDFWDVNRKKIMGSTSSHCAVAYGWSPDSRWFMTATCAPRMNIDNDVKIFRYDGSGPVVKKELEVLWDAVWQPAPPGVYPDRPASPGRKGGGERPSSAGDDSGRGAPAEEKPAVYRPPRSTGSLAAMMRAERGVDKPEVGARGKKIGRVEANKATENYIPGMGQQENKPSKNAKKQGKIHEESTPSCDQGLQENENGMLFNYLEEAAAKGSLREYREEARRRAKERDEAQKQVEAILAAASGGAETPQGNGADEADGGAGGVVDPAKRAKALAKKLKKVEGVKAKKEAGESINADQAALLASEASLREELAALQV